MNNRRLSDIEIEIMRYAAGGMTGNKTYHQVRDQFMPMDSESMGYANGGGVGSMMQPKKKKKKSNEPVVQGGVDNYLGKQPQVQAPRTWQSSPDKPATELAYITKAEKDLIIKKNIHGGLEGGPNMGPSGIMSLDSFGDVGGAGASGGDTNAGGGAMSGRGFSGRNSNTTSGREFDRQKQAQIGRLQNAENAQARSLGYSARDNITGIDRSNPNYNRSGIFSNFNPLSLISGLFSKNPLGILGSLFGKGFKGLSGKMRGINPLTGKPNTQAEYEAMVDNRRTESRRDKMQSRIDKGYNSIFGMRTGPITDQQRATLANLNTQTGVKNNVIGGDPTSTRFDGFAPRIGIQTPNYQTGSVSFDPSLGNRFNSGSVNFNPGLGNTSTVTNQPSKGIMQTISDAFFSPAAAAEIDFSQLQQANNKFTPEFSSMEMNNPGVKNYAGTTQQDFINAVQDGKFGVSGSSAFDRNKNQLFSGVDLNKSFSPFNVEPNLIGTNDGTFRQSIDIDRDALETDALNALPKNFFPGYREGGLASMFTRRR